MGSQSHPPSRVRPGASWSVTPPLQTGLQMARSGPGLLSPPALESPSPLTLSLTSSAAAEIRSYVIQIMIFAILFFQFCLLWAETYSETTGMGSSSGWLGKVRPSRLPHPSLCNEGAWMSINIQVSFYFTYGGNECRQFLSPLKAS